MTTSEELNNSFDKMEKVALKVKRDRDNLLWACRGALACLTSGDLTPEMAIRRLRNAIEQAERDTP